MQSVKQGLNGFIFFICLLLPLVFSCEYPFSLPVPLSIQGNWKWVKNDILNADGTYSHDSPVGKKCPEFWSIGANNLTRTTTMMSVQCYETRCDTLLYCYMTPFDSRIGAKGPNKFDIEGYVYSYEFENDTMVWLDAPSQNPNVTSTSCKEYSHKMHFVKHDGAVPPDDSPCRMCN
jgi:hypothetical protein